MSNFGYTNNTYQRRAATGTPSHRMGGDNGFGAVPNSSRGGRQPLTDHYYSSNSNSGNGNGNANSNVIRSLAKEVVYATRELGSNSVHSNGSQYDRDRATHSTGSGKPVYVSNNLFEDDLNAYTPTSSPATATPAYAPQSKMYGSSTGGVGGYSTTRSSATRNITQRPGMGGMGVSHNHPTSHARQNLSSNNGITIPKVILIVIVAVVASLLAFRSSKASTASSSIDDPTILSHPDSLPDFRVEAGESKSFFGSVASLFKRSSSTSAPSTKPLSTSSSASTLLDARDINTKVDSLLQKAHRGIAACVASNLFIPGKCLINGGTPVVNRNGASPSSFSHMVNQTLSLSSYIFTEDFSNTLSSTGTMLSHPSIASDDDSTNGVSSLLSSTVWLCPALNMDTFSDFGSPHIIEIHDSEDLRVSFALRDITAANETIPPVPSNTNLSDLSLRTRLLQRPLPPASIPLGSLIGGVVGTNATQSSTSTQSLKDIAVHIERASASISALDTSLNELYSGEKVLTETEQQHVLLRDKLGSEARLYRSSCQALLRDTVSLATVRIAAEEGRSAAEAAEAALNVVHDTIGSRSATLKNARAALNTALRAQGNAEQELVAASDAQAQTSSELRACSADNTDFANLISSAKASSFSSRGEMEMYAKRATVADSAASKLRSMLKKAKRRYQSAQKQLKSLEEFAGLSSTDTVPDVGRALINAIAKVRTEIDELERGVLHPASSKSSENDDSDLDEEDEDDDEDSYALNFLKNQRLRELRSTLEHLEGVRARFSPEDSADGALDGKQLMDLVTKLRQKNTDGAAKVQELTTELAAEEEKARMARLAQGKSANQRDMYDKKIAELESSAQQTAQNKESCIVNATEANEAANKRLEAAHKMNEKARNDVVKAKTALFDREAASKKEEDKALQASDVAVARARAALAALHPASESLSLSVFENDRVAGSLAHSIEQHRVVMESLRQALISYERSYQKAIEMRSTLLNILI